MNYPIIFLDLDGVLNDHKRLNNGYCGIKKENVDIFNYLLTEVPDAKIVISSAWRYMICQDAMTLLGFEYLLLSHGVQCRKKIVGFTVRDERITERKNQILHWVESNHIDNYVVLDDLDLQMENHVQTNYSVGLSFNEVDKAIKMLEGKMPKKEFVNF